jgi:hypothetical protein
MFQHLFTTANQPLTPFKFQLGQALHHRNHEPRKRPFRRGHNLVRRLRSRRQDHHVLTDTDPGLADPWSGDWKAEL